LVVGLLVAACGGDDDTSATGAGGAGKDAGRDAASGGRAGGGAGGATGGSAGMSIGGAGTGGAGTGGAGTGGTTAGSAGQAGSSGGGSAGMAGMDAGPDVSSGGSAGVDAGPDVSTGGSDAGSDGASGTGGAEGGADAEIDAGNLDAPADVPCPCVHGTCAQAGVCTTCDVGWSGTNCDTTGLGLYWKFDETTGTLASDSSGNNLHGTYVPTTSPMPTPSTMVPPGMTWDLGSLAFTFQNNPDGGTPLLREAVQLSSADGGPSLAPVKPLNNFTVAVWYKVGLADLDTSGSELVSMGDYYVVRLGKGTIPIGDGGTTPSYRIEFDKYIQRPNLADGGTQTATFIQCFAAEAPQSAGAPTWLDGNWHHVAAGSLDNGAGVFLYLDGVAQTCRTPSNSQYATLDVKYTGRGADFWVGRNGNGGTTFDFQGNVDDLRVYNRVLTATEVLALAQGVQLPPPP